MMLSFVLYVNRYQSSPSTKYLVTTMSVSQSSEHQVRRDGHRIDPFPAYGLLHKACGSDEDLETDTAHGNNMCSIQARKGNDRLQGGGRPTVGVPHIRSKYGVAVCCICLRHGAIC